jgi:hypothetical protein
VHRILAVVLLSSFLFADPPDGYKIESYKQSPLTAQPTFTIRHGNIGLTAKCFGHGCVQLKSKVGRIIPVSKMRERSGAYLQYNPNGFNHLCNHACETLEIVTTQVNSSDQKP